MFELNFICCCRGIDPVGLMRSFNIIGNTLIIIIIFSK